MKSDFYDVKDKVKSCHFGYYDMTKFRDEFMDEKYRPYATWNEEDVKENYGYIVSHNNSVNRLYFWEDGHLYMTDAMADIFIAWTRAKYLNENICWE